MVTSFDAMVANAFKYKISNPRHKRFGQMVTCRRNGKTKTWKTRPGKFKVPVKYGLYEYFYITDENAEHFEPVF